MQANQAGRVHPYLTYQKEFTPYKWYKPLLATLAGVGFFMVFTMVLSIFGFILASNQGYDLTQLLTGGYGTLDAYTPLGAIMSLGTVAVMLPAVALGNRVVNARPFSSVSSSRGGFDFGVFFKCFAVALVLVGLPLALLNLFSGENTGAVKFTVLGFILCTILAPLQCVAEEYVFRGQLMQMFGAWIKFPVIPILLQTVFFALSHPYNVTGVITVAVMGAVLGVCAYITNGLESGCALHIVNNMVAFYFAGFGFGGVQSEVAVVDLIIDVVLCALYLGFIIFADKKLGWFSRVKKDDLAAFNAKIAAREQARQSQA